MTLTLGPILASAGIDPLEALVIRHAYVLHADGAKGLTADSTDAEIVAYTRVQSAQARIFPSVPPPLWIVFLPEGGDRARLWRVLSNRGEISNNGETRVFDLHPVDLLAELQRRLVIGWRSPRTWRLRGTTVAEYPVKEIADAEPVPFPGFDALVLEHAQLQAVVRDQRYASWRTALASVIGIYLITDTRDGRVYVGKADGAETILQRWRMYATTGHGGNVRLRGLNAANFRFSLLRVFDPSTPTPAINAAESHYKRALDSVRHGLNGN